MKRFGIFVGVICLMAAGSGLAGEAVSSDSAAAATGAVVTPDPSWANPISGQVAVGYDSTYMFRGANRGENAPWGQVDLLTVAGEFTLNAGAWYVNPVSPAGAILDDANDELDLYFSATTTISFVDVWVGYTAYLYPEAGRGATNEVGIGWRSAIYFIDFGFSYFHDFNLETNYFEYFFGKNVDLNEWMVFNGGFVLGNEGTQNLHGVVTARLNVELTDAAALSAYIAYNFVDKGREELGFQDRVFGGASLSVSF
ncbi:MAG: hypothetical protein AAF591_05935 [Verrucomicrobiota bacterium]